MTYFSFDFISKEDVLKEITILVTSKAIQESNIPAKMIKQNRDFFAEIICKCFNDSLDKGQFPNCLKLASITPVFKKSVCFSKNNYRPVSIFTVLSRVI